MPETIIDSTPTSPGANEHDFTRDVREMVAEHAPRRFALVLEYGDKFDAEVYAWGIALDVAAYMTTVDGKNQYSMASAEGAVKYAPRRPNVTPHLVWVDADTEADPDE